MHHNRPTEAPFTLAVPVPKRRLSHLSVPAFHQQWRTQDLSPEGPITPGDCRGLRPALLLERERRCRRVAVGGHGSGWGNGAPPSSWTGYRRCARCRLAISKILRSERMLLSKIPAVASFRRSQQSGWNHSARARNSGPRECGAMRACKAKNSSDRAVIGVIRWGAVGRGSRAMPESGIDTTAG